MKDIKGELVEKQNQLLKYIELIQHYGLFHLMK